MKIVFKIGIILLVLASLSFLALQIISKMNQKIAREYSYEYLPPLQFLSINDISVPQYSLMNKPVLVIVFDPSCEHCSYEIRDITEHLDELSLLEIILISDAPGKDICDFVYKHGLDSIPRINVLHCDPDSFENYFGGTPVPSTFIYGANHKLLKIFKGEVKVDAIINILNYKRSALKTEQTISPLISPDQKK